MANETTPALIVTVDTEEEGLWTGTFRAHGNSVENTRGIERFQSTCDRFGVTPTYLVNTPVVDDDRSVQMLRRMQEDGRAEIGAHLHPWCSPPLEERSSVENSFLCNLPEPLQRRKIAHLTGRIEERFGRRPVSFRAGRCGFDSTGARCLEGLGYRVDSSVVPFYDYSEYGGGPDYRRAPWSPYHPEDSDLCRRARAGNLLEVPVSVGFNRRHFRLAQRLRDLAMRRPWRSLRAVGILDRLAIVRRIKFTPEQFAAADMRKLIDVYLALGAPCMVMILHSSSVVAGCSPYVPDASRLEQLYADLEETFRYACLERGMVSRTLAGFAEAFEDRHG